MRWTMVRLHPVLLVLVLSWAAACAQDGPVTVQVVGDSITRQANGNGGTGDRERDLLDALEDAGFTAWGGGVDGLRVRGAYDGVWSPDPPSDVLVIALGTNDMRDGRLPVSAVRSTLTTWLEEVPDSCVVLVEVNEGTDAWQLDAHAPAYNAMLREVAATHADGHTVRWEPSPAMLLDDGIHLTDRGREAYRQAIVDGVEQC